MFRKLAKSLIISSLIPFMLTGCFDDPNAPDGPSEVKVAVKLNDGFNTMALTNFPDWSAGKAVIDRLQFEYDGATQKIIQTVETDSVLDFATGTATPPLPSVVLDAGLYKKAKFKIHLRSEELSFELDGTWNGTPIRIESDHNEELHAMTEEFLVDAGQVYNVNIVLKPNTWFNVDGVTDDTLNNAVKDTQGRILINKTSNTDIYNGFIKNNIDDIGSFERVSG